MGNRPGGILVLLVFAATAVWVPAAQAQNGLRGEYYQEPQSQGNNVLGWQGTYLSRTDATVNFADFTPASFPDNSDDNLSVRWIGSVQAPGAAGAAIAVTFYVRTDDGGRVWVDGRIVVDRWRYQGIPGQPGPSGTVTLIGGRKYDIVVEMFEGGGGEGCILEWSYPGQSQQVIPTGNLFTQVSTPQISIASGAYTNAQVVSVRCPTSNAAIEVDPGTGTFGAYTGPFIVNANATLRARATRAGVPAAGTQLAISDTETVTVTVTDTTRPKISMVQSMGQNLVRVVFSEPVAVAGANTAANYTLLPAVGVNSAALQFDQRTVILTTAADLTETTLYVLSVSNIQDRAAAANTILPASAKVFTHRAWRTTGLVDRYTFDERTGATANDSSGSATGGNNASFPTQTADNQGPYFQETGPFLGSLRFDGENDFLTTAADLSAVMGQTTASMAVWVRDAHRTGSVNGNFYQSIGFMGVEDGAGGNDIFWGWYTSPAITTPDTPPRNVFRVGDGNNLTAGATISDGVWHHLVISRNGVNGAIRIDGNRNAVTANNLDGAVKTTPFNLIGKIVNTPFYSYFGGDMDELRLYNVELTQADAISLANTIPPVTLSGPTVAIDNNSVANLSALHVADDGIPTGTTLSYAWTLVSGPIGGVVFGTPAAQNTTATFSIPGQYLVRVTISDTHLSTSDDLLIDVAFVGITPVTGVTTTEAGGTAVITVTLFQALLAGETVTIPVSSSDPGEGVPQQGGATITQVVFNGPLPAGSQQQVTVLGVDDSIRDGDQNFQIIFGPATGPGGFAGTDPADVDCTNLDDDIPAVNFSALTGLQTTESGGTAQFTVVLQTQPQPGTTVSIALASTDTGEGTVAPVNLLFNDGNWNLPQLVTITGVDDSFIDLPQAYFITTTLTSTDPDYALISPPDPYVINLDDEVIPDPDEAWGCGALGLEAFAALGLAALLRRRRR